MAAITVRFDALYLKDEIRRVTDMKIKSVTNDSQTYEELSWAFRDAMAEVLPVDTGALAYGDVGVSRNGYHRMGDIHTTSKGLVYNPIEFRPSQEVHYGEYAVKPEMIASASLDPEFHKRATEIILEKMRNG